MIIDPQLFDDPKSKRALQKFYAAQFAIMGISTAPKYVALRPFAFNGDFTVNFNNDQYFDMSNFALGNQTLAQLKSANNRVFFDGDLKLTWYLGPIPVGIGQLNVSMWLTSGPLSGLTNWLIASRFDNSGTVPPGSINVDKLFDNLGNGKAAYYLPNTLFSHIRMQVSNTSSQGNYTCEMLFNGLQINY